MGVLALITMLFKISEKNNRITNEVLCTPKDYFENHKGVDLNDYLIECNDSLRVAIKGKDLFPYMIYKRNSLSQAEQDSIDIEWSKPRR